MRPTRAGWAALFLAGLTLMSAATTGNNLLYLAYGLLASLLLLSAVLGRLNLRRLAVAGEWPERLMAGAETPLGLRLRNAGAWSSYAVEGLERLAPGASALRWRRVTLERRGRAELALTLESSWPFGLVLHRRPLSVAGLVLPRLRPARSAAEIRAEAKPDGRPTLRRGRGGEELFGVRPHGPEDDARLINWKLTAKTGRPVVVERADPHDSKVTVRLSSTADRDVEEAASAAKFHLDLGAEVRLVTPAGDTGFGRGLPQLDRILRALAELGGAATASRLSAVQTQSDEGRLRRVLDLSSVVVLLGMALIEELSGVLFLAGGALMGAGIALRPRGWRPPRALWTAVSLSILLYTTLIDWRMSGVTVANTHLILYLLVNRAWSQLDARELRQGFLIHFLAFFLISGLTISLWYFPFFLVYFTLSAYALTLFAGGPARPLRLLLPLSLLGGALIFAGTPRLDGLRRYNPFVDTGLDKFEMRRESTIAFSENVSLGFFGELKRSSARALRLRPLAAAERPGPVRVRGAAFEFFDGRRWSKGKVYRDGGLWARREGRQLLFPARPGPTAAYDVQVFPMALSNMFTVDAVASAEADDAAYYDHTDAVYFAQPHLAGARYRLYSRRGALGFPQKPGVLERFLRLPENLDPRIAELSAALAKERGPEETARAVESHLREAYGYSSYSDSADRTLPDFLFKTRRGNCEYFATAMAVMLRQARIPSRLVTGFYSDEWNEFGRFYDVRQGQAHAWVEAYVEGKGWLTFDPTPPQSALSGAAEALGRKAQRWFNAVQAKWYANVIGYDQYVQRNTFRRLSVGFSAEGLLPWLYRGAALSALLLAGMAFSRMRIRRADDFFTEAQAKLERAGYKREPWWTPREYAQSVGLPEFKELAELHYVDRYARVLTAEQRARAKALCARIKSQ